MGLGTSSFANDDIVFLFSFYNKSQFFGIRVVSVENNHFPLDDFCHPTGGALAEGFKERLKEFQSFERRFEVCLTPPPMSSSVFIPTSQSKIYILSES